MVWCPFPLFLNIAVSLLPFQFYAYILSYFSIRDLGPALRLD